MQKNQNHDIESIIVPHDNIFQKSESKLLQKCKKSQKPW